MGLLLEGLHDMILSLASITIVWAYGKMSRCFTNLNAETFNAKVNQTLGEQPVSAAPCDC